MEWISLERGDDWGTQYLAFKATDKQGYCSTKRALKFEDGESIRVKWPDGTETTERITNQTIHGRYSDHGHEHTTESKIAGIQCGCRGIPFWIPLDQPGLLIQKPEKRSA